MVQLTSQPKEDKRGAKKGGALKPVAIFTVDVEEWFQVGAYEGVIDTASWQNCERRIPQQMDIILDLLAGAGASATFFSLASAAKDHPSVIRRIVEAGHELASHGCMHQRVHTMTREEFAADARASKQCLEDVSGVAVRGYRAPNFSFDSRTPWAHDVLIEAGYAYSSSFYPVQHDHYGVPHAPRRLFYPKAGADFAEIPMSTAHMLGRRVPASGGGFFRLLPYALSRALMRRAAQELKCPPIFYMHPWEVDPGQPRVSGASVKSQFRHRVGLGRNTKKLARLLRDFQWQSVQDTYHNVFRPGSNPALERGESALGGEQESTQDNVFEPTLAGKSAPLNTLDATRQRVYEHGNTAPSND